MCWLAAHLFRSTVDAPGTGAVGLSAAAFGARHTVLSDVDSPATVETEGGWEERSTLSILADNVALNASVAAAVSVAELRWGADTHIAVRCRRIELRDMQLHRFAANAI